MPTIQKHRGSHPKDAELFHSSRWPELSEAILDYYFLLNKNYGENASLTLVGDRYKLRKRQRYALQRIVSPRAQVLTISKKVVPADAVVAEKVYLDGFNILILAEVLLSGGFVFQCIDGMYRDIASIHGSYHKVMETEHAILLIGHCLAGLNAGSVTWYFDKPVSNSGKLKKKIEEIAEKKEWYWKIFLHEDPDQKLISLNDGIIISSDRFVIENCRKCFNFSEVLLSEFDSKKDNIISFKKLGIDDKLIQESP